MKKLRLVLFVSVAGAFFWSCQKEEPVMQEVTGVPEGTGTNFIKGSYIVELEESFAAPMLKSASGPEEGSMQVAVAVRELLAENELSSSKVGNIYTSVFSGFSVEVNDQESLDKLKSLAQVKSVEQDQVFSINQEKSFENDGLKSQSVSYGASRVGIANGSGKRAWIVDTGIDLDHPDLTVNRTLSRSFVSTTAEDGNGHGTHVAGIIGARNNTIGTIGVAYGAELIAIKVLADNGSGSTSAIIAGLDYIGKYGKPGEVVNMSLGGGISYSLDNAVLKIASKGLRVAVAAGNSAIHANNTSPARVNAPNVYTVSAMGTSDIWASYSNFGNPPVDFCAPGSYIYSTYKNGSYASLSGTSMAAPHVAGILLIRGKPSVSGRVQKDPDGNADYIAHL